MSYRDFPPGSPRPWSHVIAEIALWLVVAAGAALATVHFVGQ